MLHKENYPSHKLFLFIMNNPENPNLHFLGYLERSFIAEDLEDIDTIIQFNCTNPSKIHPKIKSFMEQYVDKRQDSNIKSQYATDLHRLKSTIQEEIKIQMERQPIRLQQKLPVGQVQQQKPEIILSQRSQNPQQQSLVIPFGGHIPQDVPVQQQPGLPLPMVQQHPQVQQPDPMTDVTDQVVFIVQSKYLDISALEPLMIDFANSFTGRQHACTSETFQLTKEINVHDELGEWSYDHLQGCMRMYFKLKSGRGFPGAFSIKTNHFTSIVREALEIQQIEEEDEQDITLEQFLKQAAYNNGKANQYVQHWLEYLGKNHCYTFEELMSWEDSDWEKASDIKIGSIKILKKELNKFKYNKATKKQNSYSKSEIFSMEHRIRRFLIYKTQKGLLKNIEDLDRKALEEGFKEIEQEYTGKTLLNQLKTFYITYSIPRSYSKSLLPSRGMLLYGPPGTGKTTLTDTLPTKIGLTQITYPLCAAEVNRGIVGQTEKLLLNLVARARQIPYLLCCVAIDEIDGLAPKRDDKSSQHKVDALAVLLSVIGGIKDVPNLIFVASTNRLNMMDEAFKRRLSGQYFVGRPSPEARKIMLDRAEKLYLDENMKQQLVMMTSNFSGAALKQLISDLVGGFIDGSAGSQIRSMTFEELAGCATKISKQFTIKLGNYSLPELFCLQRSKEKLITIPFLRQLENGTGIITFGGNSISLRYLRKRILDPFNGDSVREIDSVEMITNTPIDNFFQLWEQIRKQCTTGSYKPIIASYITLLEVENLTINSILDRIKTKILLAKQEAQQTPEKVFLVLWDDTISFLNSNKYMKKEESKCVMKHIIDIFDDQNKEQQNDQKNRPSNLYHLFITSNENHLDFVKATSWGRLAPFNKRELKYKGLIMIDLDDEEQEMRFQLDEEGDDSYQLHSEPLLLEKRANNSFTVIPKIVEFATSRKIDFLLLMDQDFLLSNNAFDETKIMENITEKMQEFDCYDKSMLIIDVDSIAGMVSSTSHSSMGPSTSFSLADNKLYSKIIHYANSKPKILNNSEYWVALISRNPELSKMIKHDLRWPKSAQELKQQQLEEQKLEEVQCTRCDQKFTEAKNELNQCIYHPGAIIESSAPKFQWIRIFSIKDARSQQIQRAIQQRQQQVSNQESKDPTFIYLCCLQPLSSQGCTKDKHTVQPFALDPSENQFLSLKNI